jgi:hypothetical protein
MPINPALLICPAVLQLPFVDDSTGEALSAGIVTLYQDNSRTILKNWYSQTGTPGNYNYEALPNPMTLSAAGTPCDVNGNDVLPMYYPYSETDNFTPQPYYVVVTNSNTQQEFTRQNFPFSGSQEPSPSSVPTHKNYIINNVFWRNCGSLNLQNITSTLASNICLAPSQHGGFSMPDFQFYKSTAGATETVSFVKFPLGSTPFKPNTDPTPEFYLNHVCTGAELGETYKYYQFPISLHINTLDSVTASVTIQALNSAGNANNEIVLQILQFWGTNASGQPGPVQIGTFRATSQWNKYTFNFTFPSTLGANLSGTGDDAYYLQIAIPAAVTTNLSFTLPGIYLSSDVPTNDLNTYDQIDAIINSPRTGDFKYTVSTFQPFGWVAANDQNIGSLASNADGRANIDTWPLYSLIWNTIPQYFAPVAGGKGGSAYADFTANKAMQLPLTLGRVFAASNADIPVLITFTTDYASNNYNLTVPTAYFYGTPVVLEGGSLPSGLSADTVYFVYYVNATTIRLCATIEDTSTATAINIGSDGSGTIFNAKGAFTGASTNTAVPAHTHTFTGTNYFVQAGGTETMLTGGGGFGITNDVIPTGTIGSTGSATVGNIQPTTYFNLLLKL